MDENHRRYIEMVAAVILADLKRRELPKPVVKESLTHIIRHCDEMWENITDKELINSYR